MFTIKKRLRETPKRVNSPFRETYDITNGTTKAVLILEDGGEGYIVVSVFHDTAGVLVRDNQ